MPKPRLPDTVPQNPPSGLHLTNAMFHILLSLADGQKHGYGIMRELEERQAAVLGPGTLYGAIKRMLEAGLIGGAGGRGGGEARSKAGGSAPPLLSSHPGRACRGGGRSGQAGGVGEPGAGQT